jgi:hypothetical protein
MRAASTDSPSRKSRVGGKAAGAGGGTLMVLLANTLPEHSVWRPWILAAAPSVTVALSAISSVGFGAAVNYIKKKRLDLALSRAKKRTEEDLKKEGLSLKQKQIMKRHLEDIQKIQVSNEMQLIRNLVRVDEMVSLPRFTGNQNLGQVEDGISSPSDDSSSTPKNVSQTTSND